MARPRNLFTQRAGRVFRFAFLVLFMLAAISGFAANTIQLENAKPGTTAWRISNLSSNQADIQGYASLTSVNRGGTINFFVSTTSPTYTIDIYRVGWYGGAGGRQLLGPISRTGIAQPMPSADATGLRECNWTDPYSLTIPNDVADPTDWASGMYVAKLTASGGAQNYIMFVVRDDNRTPAADFLYQSPVNTWQAYNNWGGQSLYASNSSNNVQARAVSFNRPYAVDGAGDFFQWEINLVRFLEREAYDVSYATNIDLQEQGLALIAPHKAFLSAGHDEYWSYQMKSALHQARDQGKHLAFFGSDAIYWQVRYQPSIYAQAAANRNLVSYKEAAQASDPYWLDGDSSNDKFVTTRFRDLASPPYNVVDPIAQPENALVGVMYHGSPFNGDIVVSDASNWIFNGMGVSNGTHLSGLLGYENDAMFSNGYAPAGLQKIAESADDWGNAHMTTYTAPSGAVIFSTGSMQWSWGLDDYGSGVPSRGPSRVNASVQQATRNVLARLSTVVATVPGAPLAVSAVAGNAQATVSFSSPVSNGGSAITGYTVTSNPAGGVDSNAGSTALSHVLTGLSNGTNYTFTVTAANAIGNSAPSAASNSVMPIALSVLSNGVPVNNISGAQGSMLLYQITVPSGAANLRFMTSGGSSGDVDIYAKFNAFPTVTAYDVKSDGPTRNETISIATPQAGTWYLLLYGDWNTYGGVTLVAAFDIATPPGSPTGVGAIAGNAQATVSFSAPASNGGSAITGYTVASNPAGGVDSNAGSTTLSHVLTGLSNGTNYTFTVTAANAIGKSVPSAASNSVMPIALSTVSNGLAVNNISGAQGSVLAYQITVPSGAANLRFATSGGSGGDVDIFAKFNGIPTVSVYDAKSDGPTRSEAITIAAPQAGTWYLLLYGDWGSYAGVTLLASFDSAGASPPDSPTAVSAIAGNAQATVSFAAPLNNGGASITGYAVTSHPAGGVDGDGGTTAMSHVVTGLVNGTSYNFTVTASNLKGSGAASLASNNVTPVAPAATQLTKGVPIANISGALGSVTMYQITVLAGATNLSFVTSGGSGGDVDIFAKFNALPTVTAYDAKSDGPTRNESITIAAPQAGTWYLMLYGDWSNYAGVTLLATYGP